MTRDNRFVSRRRFVEAASTGGIIGLAGCSGDGGGNGNGNGDSTGNGNGNGNGGSSGSDYPSRDIEVVVGWGAGGGTDTLHRTLADPAESAIRDDGHELSLSVSNITGASAMNSASYVLEQPADGYTIWGNTNGIALNIVQGNAPFEFDDWEFVLQVEHDTSWMYTSGEDGNGVSDMDELISRMEAGDDVTIGNVGSVRGAVFVLQWANALDVLDGFSMVTYDDSGRMTTDVATGEITAALGNVQELQEQYKSGDIDLILAGVDGDIQNDEYSDVTTVSDIGAPEATYGSRRGVVVKSGTPEEKVQYIHDVWREAMLSDKYQDLAAERLTNIRDGYLNGEEYEQAARDLMDTYEQMGDLAEQVKSQ